MLKTFQFLAATAALVALLFSQSHAQDESDLAKQTQNPIADLISVPLQSNFNFGAGSKDKMIYILNVQPVIPIKLNDELPTLMAAAGVPDVKEQLLKGMKVGDKTFKVHLDGYNLTDALAGKTPSPRHEFFYFNDDGSLVALRYNNWKLVFAEQRAHGIDVWREPFVVMRAPKIFNLRTDPFETADHEAVMYNKWWIDRAFLFVPGQQYVGQFLATFKEFPPSQKVGSFSLDAVLESLSKGPGNQ
jgi:hypothetical protein